MLGLCFDVVLRNSEKAGGNPGNHAAGFTAVPVYKPFQGRFVLLDDNGEGGDIFDVHAVMDEGRGQLANMHLEVMMSANTPEAGYVHRGHPAARRTIGTFDHLFHDQVIEGSSTFQVGSVEFPRI